MPIEQIGPTIVFLGFVAWAIRRNSGRPIAQIYILIVAGYLNVFPTLDFLFSSGDGMDGFRFVQLIIIVFFELPLLLFLTRRHGSTSIVSLRREPQILRLNKWLPIFLGLILLTFWFVALEYDLFFRRQGFEGLQQASAAVPAPLLYVYRGAVETSYFVIVFLMCTLRLVRSHSPRYRNYKVVLVCYATTFAVFFAANSRMQFLLLLICIFCTQPRAADYVLRRIGPMLLATLALGIVVGLTLFRELYLEGNERLQSDDVAQLMYSVGWLIAARLDSVMILSPLVQSGFDPFGFNLSGVTHVFNFYVSFFVDPAAYAAVKESLVTSPSVVIVNRLMGASEVDFPKSMMLDVFLSFGVVGLIVSATFLGNVILAIQNRILTFDRISREFVLAIYILPMLMEFEKEFLGFFVTFLKWSPFLILVWYLRPAQLRSVITAGVSQKATGPAQGST